MLKNAADTKDDDDFVTPAEAEDAMQTLEKTEKTKTKASHFYAHHQKLNSN